MRIDLVPVRQALRMLLQLCCTEEFGSQWQIVSEVAEQAIDTDARLKAFEALSKVLPG